VNYVVVGINHKTAPLGVREKLALPSEAVRDALARLRRHPSVRETAVLSTCNRVEIYGATPNPPKARECLSDYFREALSDGDAASCLYAMTDRDAVAHLFEVTASLDSLVVGENQIAKQVREAHQVAADCSATGPYLNRLFNRALFVAKRVKTETEVGRGNVSVGSVGAALAKRIFGSLANRTVVLLGAGEIGELVLRHLKTASEAGETFIVNRSAEKARELESQGLGTALPLANLEDALVKTDVLITSLSGGYEAFNKAYFAGLMHKRLNEPLFIVDLGVPRNIAADVSRLDNVYVYDVDDLKTMADGDRKQRANAVDAAKMIVAEETRLFYEDYLGQKALPTIAGLNRKFDDIRRREVEKTLAKMAHLSEADRAVIDQMTRSIVARVLHDPILNLKTGGAAQGAHGLAVLKKIFSLDDEVDDDR
jgi:glutamyl-tRNA reductase